jgi:hypothetical protein
MSPVYTEGGLPLAPAVGELLFVKSSQRLRGALINEDNSRDRAP